MMLWHTEKSWSVSTLWSHLCSGLFHSSIWWYLRQWPNTYSMLCWCRHFFFLHLQPFSLANSPPLLHLLVQFPTESQEPPSHSRCGACTTCLLSFFTFTLFQCHLETDTILTYKIKYSFQVANFILNCIEQRW